MEILRLTPKDSPLSKLASEGPPPEWIKDELRPYTIEDLVRELRELAELEGSE